MRLLISTYWKDIDNLTMDQRDAEIWQHALLEELTPQVKARNRQRDNDSFVQIRFCFRQDVKELGFAFMDCLDGPCFMEFCE